MKKNPGRKERRNAARANRKADGRRRMAIHNWRMKVGKLDRNEE